MIMPAALGFDSSVLSPFARTGRLDVLERLVAGHQCVVTQAVLDELDRGCVEHPALADVKALPWLEIVTIDSLEKLKALTAYVRALGSDERNIGEASILAWAEVASGIAMVDDNTGRAGNAAGRRADLAGWRSVPMRWQQLSAVG